MQGAAGAFSLTTALRSAAATGSAAAGASFYAAGEFHRHSMKLLIAYLKPFKVSEVVQALQEIGVARMSVSEVKGYGRQRGHSELYKGTEYQVDFVPKSRIEIALDDDEAEQAIEAITRVARTDTIGDGKIFLVDLDQAVRIRTGERGPDAL